jgi:hypothetical protein
MSQTGYTPIQHYRTSTASAVPSAGNLADGELAINLADKKVYTKDSGGNVVLVGANVTPVANGGTNATTAAQALINLGERTSATGSLIVPSGTTGQQDASPAAGYLRFNTSISKFEGYTGSAWSSVGGGATGGGSDAVFVQNGQTVTTSYSIPSGQNAMSTGPITVNSGVTVTIPSGSRWVVL